MTGPDFSDPLAWRSVTAPTLDVIEVIAGALRLCGKAIDLRHDPPLFRERGDVDRNIF